MKPLAVLKAGALRVFVTIWHITCQCCSIQVSTRVNEVGCLKVNYLVAGLIFQSAINWNPIIIRVSDSKKWRAERVLVNSSPLYACQPSTWDLQIDFVLLLLSLFVTLRIHQVNSTVIYPFYKTLCVLMWWNCADINPDCHSTLTFFTFHR
jgi:hypothetical protein